MRDKVHKKLLAMLIAFVMVIGSFTTTVTAESLPDSEEIPITVDQAEEELVADEETEEHEDASAEELQESEENFVEIQNNAGEVLFSDGEAAERETAERDRFVTVTGGEQPRDGLSWETAYNAEELQKAWDDTPADGTLFIAGGEYSEHPGILITSDNDGMGPVDGVTCFKKIVGVDTGDGNGRPKFIDLTSPRMLSDAINGVRLPSKCSDTALITISGGSYIWVENLYVEAYRQAVWASTAPDAELGLPGGALTGLRIYDLEVKNANNSLLIAGSADRPITDVVIMDCNFLYYVKSGIRISTNVQDVLVKDCLADAGGEPEYVWGGWPVGYQLHSGNPANGWEERITFVNCIALNSFQAVIQPGTAPTLYPGPGDYDSGQFFNGDGWTAEPGSRDINIIRCASIGHTDGAYDMKTVTVMMLDSLALDCENNYKIWGTATLINCLSAEAFSRRGAWGGGGRGTGLAPTGEGKIVAYNSTLLGSENSESGSNATVYNSVIMLGGSRNTGSLGGGAFFGSIIYTNGYSAPSGLDPTNTVITGANPINGISRTQVRNGTDRASGIPFFNKDNIQDFLNKVYVEGIYDSIHGAETPSRGYVSSRKTVDPDAVTDAYYSNIPKNAQQPTIDSITENQDIDLRDPVTLTVAASVSDGGSLTYQWYKSETSNVAGGTAIAGATGTSYDPPTNVAGTFYYFVAVTNTTGPEVYQVSSRTSNVVRVRVIDSTPPVPGRTTLLNADFDFNDTESRPVWRQVGSATNGSVSYPSSTGNSSPFAQIVRSMELPFEAVPLNENGGESPGSNARLIAEFKLAKMADAGNNYGVSGLTNTAASANSFAASAATLSTDKPLYFYSLGVYQNGYNPAVHPTLYEVASGNGIDTWVKFKFVVTITDKDGNFIKPTVDVYVTDAAANWEFSENPAYANLQLLSNLDSVNALRVATDGGSPRNAIDDVFVYLQVDETDPYEGKDISQLLTEDFEAAAPAWSRGNSEISTGISTGNPPVDGTRYGTVSVPSAGGTNDLRYAELKFDAIALSQAGADALGQTSPGANATLVAEYKMAKTANGGGRYLVSGLSGSANKNLNSYAASAWMYAGDGSEANKDRAMIYYHPGGFTGTITSATPRLYEGPDYSWNTGSLNVWVQIKFEVVFTDASGNYITPYVNVYVTDASKNWKYDKKPVNTVPLGLLGSFDMIDVFRVSVSAGATTLGVDDINIFLVTDSVQTCDCPDLPIDHNENSRYVTVTGGHEFPLDGTSWCRAFAAVSLQAAWNATPSDGTLYVAGGTYEDLGLIISAASGGLGETPDGLVFKKLVGLDTDGTGKPKFIDTRERPLSSVAPNRLLRTTNNLITLQGGANYVWIENIYGVGYFTVVNALGNNRGLRIYDIDTKYTENSILLTGSGTAPIRDVVIENCYFYLHAKGGIRINTNVADALIKDCTSDAGGAENYWYDNWTVGFQLIGNDTSAWEKDITFINCVALNGFQAPLAEPGAPNSRTITGHGGHQFTVTDGAFWNGDGFTAERGSRNLTFIRSLAMGSTDGGWDLKSDTALFLDCAAINNKCGFKLWSQEKAVLINSLAAYAYRRGGTGEANNIESAGGNIILYNSTVIGGHEYDFRFSGGGSYFGNITVNDSVIVRAENAGKLVPGDNMGYADRMQDGIITFNNSHIYTNGIPQQVHDNLIYNNTEIVTTAGDYAGIAGYSGSFGLLPWFNRDTIGAFYNDIYENGIFDSSHGPDKGFWGITKTPIPDHAQNPVIDFISNDLNIDKNVAASLAVSAGSVDGGVLSYQWYSSTLNTNIGGRQINGATGAAFNPPTDSSVLGAMFYYVAVTNKIETKGFDTATVVSQPIRVFVVGEPEIDPDAPPRKEIPIYREDFEVYTSTEDLRAAGWTTNASELGTRVNLETPEGNNYARINPQTATVNFPLGVSIPLTQAGADALGMESPGANAQLVAEYRLMKPVVGSGGNYLSAMFARSTRNDSNGAFGASLLLRNTTPGLFRYANGIGSNDQPPILYLGGPKGADPAENIGVWVQFKYVVTITDESGSFITPRVDVYVTDEADFWQYSSIPVYSGNLLVNDNFIDTLRFASGGSTAHLGIDDIRMYYLVDDAKAEVTDAEFLRERAAGILLRGLTKDQLRLEGKILTLVIDGREFVLSTKANNRNIDGEIPLGDGNWLRFDIKGNGSNVKEFRIFQRQ